MVRIAALTVLILASAFPGPAPAADSPQVKEIAKELQAILDHTVASDASVPGVLARVSAPRVGLDWSGASGHLGLHGSERLQPDQPFRIASITKVFTAATLFRLIEQRRLGLYDRIAPRLSETTLATLIRGGYDPSQITIQQLLAHTSGLYDYAMDPAYGAAVVAAPHKRWTRAEQIAFAVDHGKPVGEPGERYSYSDTGYVILGEIIERATREPLPRALREQLNYRRVGLSATYFETQELTPRTAPPLAHQYLGPTDATEIDPSFDLFGGGGLVSTTGDLTRFLRALLQGQVFRKGGTLAAALMTVSAQHDAGERLHSNMLTTLPFGRRVCWGHQGFWGSAALYCPDVDVAVALTVNQAETDHPDTLRSLARAIAQQLEKLPNF